MEPEEADLTPGQDVGTAVLRHAEVGRDADPDDDERGKDPEQKCRLADGQPRQVVALEEESNPSRATAVNVHLDDLAAYRCGGVTRRLLFAVAVQNRALRRSRARHGPSVALGTRYAGLPKRSSR